jgi:DNA-binding NarL/FixJ family response regulator
MNSKPICVFIVDADPAGGQLLAARLGEIEGANVVGVVQNRNAAEVGAETLEPGVLLVDLMLPCYRSIDIVRHVAGTQPQVHILALAPSDPPGRPTCPLAAPSASQLVVPGAYHKSCSTANADHGQALRACGGTAQQRTGASCGVWIGGTAQ